MGVDHRPNETSPVPSSAFTTSRSPYAGEFFGAAFPGFFTPSVAFTLADELGSPWFPFRG